MTSFYTYSRVGGDGNDISMTNDNIMKIDSTKASTQIPNKINVATHQLKTKEVFAAFTDFYLQEIFSVK